jgi:hypothetical protein
MTWFEKYLDEESPIGDLCRDAKESGDAPDDLNDLLPYLEKRGACDEAMDAAKELQDVDE